MIAAPKLVPELTAAPLFAPASESLMRQARELLGQARHVATSEQAHELNAMACGRLSVAICLQERAA